MRAGHVTLMIVAAVFVRPMAGATTLDCARLLASFHRPESAIARFDARAEALRAAFGGRGVVAHVLGKYHGALLAASAAVLATKNVDCLSVTASLYRNDVMLTSPSAAIRLIHRVCQDDAATVTTLTRAAFMAYSRADADLIEAMDPKRPAVYDRERSHLEKWLVYARRQAKLSREQWLEVIGSSASHYLAVSAAVGGNVAVIGLTGEDRVVMAKALLRAALPMDTVIARARLPKRKYGELVKDYDPLQRLTILSHSPGRPTPADLEDFDRRLGLQKPFANPAVGRAAAERTIVDLVREVTVPVETIHAIDAILARHAVRLYGKPLNVAWASENFRTLTQRERAERFFGRGVTDRANVVAEKRQLAKYVAVKLSHAKFRNADEFIRAFKLKNVYREAAGRRATVASEREAELERIAVAEVYFRVLRHRLPEFLALRPTMMQARWLLETPLQFKDDFDDSGRRLGRRLIKTPRLWFAAEPRREDILRDILAIQRQTIRRLRSSMRKIDDWFELALFQTGRGPNYESVKHWAIESTFDDAIRLGDRALSWLDYVDFDVRESSVTPASTPRLPRFYQLLLARGLLTPANRRPRAIKDEIVALLVEAEDLHDEARRHWSDPSRPRHLALARMYAHFTVDPARADEPNEVDRTIDRVRAGLFRFLEAYGASEGPVTVERAQVDALRWAAKRAGFSVGLLITTNDEAHVTIYR